MDARKFENLKHKISKNQLRRLVFEDDAPDLLQAGQLSLLIQQNQSITELTLLNATMKLDTLALLLSAFIKSDTLRVVKVKSQLMTLPQHGAGLRNFVLRNVSVRELDLSGCNFGDIIISAFTFAIKKNRAITKLNLSSNNIGLEGSIALFNAMKINSTITDLDLTNNNIHAGIDSLSDMLDKNTTLTSLNLNKNNLEQIDAHKLSRSCNPSLRTLSIEDNHLGGIGLSFLTGLFVKNNNLHSLFLENNQIENDGMAVFTEALEGYPKLCTLGLSNNSLGDAGGLAIARIVRAQSSLISLFAGNCSVGQIGTSAIVSALQDKTSLVILDISHLAFNAESVAELAHVLPTCVSLKDLDLSNCSLQDNNIVSIASTLMSCASLKKLSIKNNQTGMLGARALANYLKFTQALKFLDMSENALQDEAGSILVEGLITNSSLKKLLLYGNQLGLRTADALASALKCNEALEELDLEYNSMKPNGLFSLLLALRRNISLRALKLSGNQIGHVMEDIDGVTIYQIQDFLLQALRENHSVRKPLIESLYFDATFKASFAALLKVNQKIEKLLFDYREDMSTVSAHVSRLIKSKNLHGYADPQFVYLSNLREASFTVCIKLAMVEGKIAIASLDEFVLQHCGYNSFLPFYNWVKDLFAGIAMPNAPIYSIRFFRPGRKSREEYEVEASHDGNVMQDTSIIELALNHTQKRLKF